MNIFSSRRIFAGHRLGWLFISVISLPCGLFAQGTKAHSKAPDIFLITIDTLRADHIHCYGYDQIQTPALDGLASDGIRFTEAFTPVPITSASHASILTGLQPSRHGVTDFGMPLAADHPTMAESLKREKFQTAAFIGAIILDSKTLAPGFDRGFDFYDNFPSNPDNKERWGRLERRGIEVVHHAQTWLNGHPTGKRFVWIHLYDPHDPYEPPPPFSSQYSDRLYDGEIAFADYALGNFVGYLKKKGWYQNSLIVVAGDHGEGLGEHSEQTHGIFLYDSTTHVPLIIKLPADQRSAKAKIVDAQVRTTDILPTVLAITRVAAPPNLDGSSLTSLFDHAEATERNVLGETDYPLRFGWSPLRSVRAGGVKFIEASRPELYDLKTDPAELKNKYQPWDNAVKQARGVLAEARTRTPAAPPAASAVSEHTLDELKALGYLGRADVGSSTTVPEPSLLPDPKDKIEEQNLIHQAMMAAEDSRLDDAYTSLQKALQLDPDSFVVLEQLGEIQLKSGNAANAVEHLKRAHDLHPGDFAAGFALGQALEKQGDHAGAQAVLESSLKLNPESFPARLLLGQVYLALNKPFAAADQFQAALLLKPEDSEATRELAQAQNLANLLKK